MSVGTWDGPSAGESHDTGAQGGKERSPSSPYCLICKGHEVTEVSPQIESLQGQRQGLLWGGGVCVRVRYCTCVCVCSRLQTPDSRDSVWVGG